MRTGKIQISRGSQFAKIEKNEPRLTLVPSAPNHPSEAAEVENPQAELLRSIGDRVNLLERLARLRAEGLLSPEEFAAEKAFLIGAPVDSEHYPAVAELPGRPGSSLVGRLFSWKFLPLGLVAGLALSFGAQPQETLRVFDQS